MFSQSFRAPWSLASRATPRSTGMVIKRFFIAPTPIRRADLVQDIYIRELRAYKPPSIKASDSEGHVQRFTPPSPPPSPEESDLTNELKEYEASSVDIEGQAEAGSAGMEDDWLESEPEDDENKHH